MTKQTVCLHGWAKNDGNQEYADFDAGEHCDGFCAYLRIDAPGGEAVPFEVPAEFERDFPTIEEARAYAAKLGTERGADIFEY